MHQLGARRSSCSSSWSLPRYGSPPEVKEHGRLHVVATVSDLRRALKVANEHRVHKGEDEDALGSHHPAQDATASANGRPHAWEHTAEQVSLTQAMLVPAKLHIAAQRIRRKKKQKKKLAGPNTSRVGRLLPSIQECLNKFWSDEVNADDLLRLRVVFRSMSEDGLHAFCDCLPELMMRSGFHTLSDQKCRDLVQQITTFDYMDFQDFSDFSERAILEERKGFQSLLKTWDGNLFDNFVEPAEQVRGFLNKLKVICTRQSILEILDFAGLKDERCDSAQEMLRFLAAYQSCEGFTKKEISQLRSAFKSCEERPGVGPEGKLISPSHVGYGMLLFGGIYFLETWRSMKHHQKTNVTGVSFYEFLVHARRVRETELQLVAEAVEMICDIEPRQSLIEELRTLVRSVGFTLQEAEVTEICRDQGMTSATPGIALDEPFSLDVAWDFVCAMRSCHGFTHAEKAELLDSFQRFSKGESEISTLKILELMNWLGQSGCIEKAHEMLRRVDFDGNGVLGESEFLRLMRMQKESNMETYTAAYCKLRLGDAITRSRLEAALAECEIFPENQILEVITLRHGIKTTCVSFESYDNRPSLPGLGAGKARRKLPGITWDTWIVVAEEARKVTPIWNRKRACFKEPEVLELKKNFGAEQIPVSDLLWMLLDSGIPLQHAEDRHQFHDALEEARRTAVEAGSMEGVEEGTREGHVHFATFLHLIRGYLQSIKQKQIKREEAALRNTNFSATEVADFRAIFSSHVLSAHFQARQELQKEACHPLSFLVRRLAMQPRVSCSEVIKMAASIGARIKMSHRSMLRRKIREFSDQGKMTVEEEELPDDDGLLDGVDFAGFLRIMQWMSQCNWCNINTAAEELLLNPSSSDTPSGFSRCVSAP